MDDIAEAKALTAELQDSKQSLCCSDCLRVFAVRLNSPNSQTLIAVRTHCHAFLDACMAVVSTPRSSDELKNLDLVLLRKTQTCRRYHAVQPASATIDQHILFFDALLHCILPSITVGPNAVARRTRPNQRFNKNGYWPTTIDRLFPHGETESVEAYVFWCSQLISPAPILLLYSLLSIARPIVFPLLLTKSLHDKMIWTLVHMLISDTSTPWPGGADPCVLPNHWKLGVWLGATLPEVCAGILLHRVCWGVDTNYSDRGSFTAGYEALLFHALQTALDIVQPSGNPNDKAPFGNMVGLAVELHHRLNLPLEQLHPIARAKREEMASGKHYTLALILGAYLQRVRKLRSCSGPGCGVIGQRQEESRFLVCSGCKIVRYCGKACQKAHWTRQEEQSFPDADTRVSHRDSCGALGRLHAQVVHDFQGRDAFEAAFDKADISDADMSTLVSTAMDSDILTDEMKFALGRLIAATTNEHTGVDWAAARRAEIL